jgi:RNA polymerase sigma-70 factor, ECF subfamily
VDIELRKELEKRCLQAIPDVQKLIKKYVSDYNDQCDVLQDTLTSAWSKLEDLREPYNVEGWLKTISRNKCFDWLKDKTKIAYIADINCIADESEIENNEITLEEYEHLLEGINQLSYPLRNVVMMKYFTHNSIKDISKLLQIPEGTIKRRLHDARKKLRKEFGMKTSKTAPKIEIIEKQQRQSSIKKLGFGLNFGSPLAGIGDKEFYEAYEYPGRIYTNKFYSEVTRKATVLGNEVLEVVDKSLNKDCTTEKYYYYNLTEDVLSMPFRVLNFSGKLKIDIDQQKLMSPECTLLSTGKYNNPENNEAGIVDIVDVIIDSIKYKDVLRDCSSSDDFHGRCYMERFYNQEGREILHRNYFGKNWKMGDYVTWDKWKDSPEIEFIGEKFRLWFEFVKVES